MKVSFVNHNAPIVVGDYQFADRVKEQVLSSLKTCNPISQDNSNVKAAIIQNGIGSQIILRLGILKGI